MIWERAWRWSFWIGLVVLSMAYSATAEPMELWETGMRKDITVLVLTSSDGSRQAYAINTIKSEHWGEGKVTQLWEINDNKIYGPFQIMDIGANDGFYGARGKYIGRWVNFRFNKRNEDGSYTGDVHFLLPEDDSKRLFFRSVFLSGDLPY